MNTISSKLLHTRSYIEKFSETSGLICSAVRVDGGKASEQLSQTNGDSSLGSHFSIATTSESVSIGSPSILDEPDQRSDSCSWGQASAAVSKIDPTPAKCGLLVGNLRGVVYSGAMPRSDQSTEGLKNQIKELREDFEHFSQAYKTPLQVLQDWAWSRKWKITCWVGGIIVAIATGLFRAWPYMESAAGKWTDSRIAGQLKEPTKDLSSLHEDVTAIKATLDTLKPLIDGVLLEKFKSATALPQSEFQRKLPQIQNLISIAKQQGLSVDPALVRRMSEKLLSIKPRVPDFWPMSAELVS